MRRRLIVGFESGHAEYIARICLATEWPASASIKRILPDSDDPTDPHEVFGKAELPAGGVYEEEGCFFCTKKSSECAVCSGLAVEDCEPVSLLEMIEEDEVRETALEQTDDYGDLTSSLVEPQINDSRMAKEYVRGCAPSFCGRQKVVASVRIFDRSARRVA